MIETVEEELPVRWQGDWWIIDSKRRVRKGKLQAIRTTSSDDDVVYILQDWLEEIYFDGNKEKTPRKADIRHIGALIRKMLCLGLSVRAPARDVLRDFWLEDH